MMITKFGGRFEGNKFQGLFRLLIFKLRELASTESN